MGCKTADQADAWADRSVQIHARPFTPHAVLRGFYLIPRDDEHILAGKHLGRCRLR